MANQRHGIAPEGRPRFFREVQRSRLANWTEVWRLGKKSQASSLYKRRPGVGEDSLWNPLLPLTFFLLRRRWRRMRRWCRPWRRCWRRTGRWRWMERWRRMRRWPGCRRPVAGPLGRPIGGPGWRCVAGPGWRLIFRPFWHLIFRPLWRFVARLGWRLITGPGLRGDAGLDWRLIAGARLRGYAGAGFGGNAGAGWRLIAGSRLRSENPGGRRRFPAHRGPQGRRRRADLLRCRYLPDRGLLRRGQLL